jgi:putative intracellular protease/amidase
LARGICGALLCVYRRWRHGHRCVSQRGQPPLDPASDTPDAQTADTNRFKADAAAQDVLRHTVELVSVHPADYDAVFYPGGHGPLWDLAEDPVSIALITAFATTGKPVATVCHAPGVLRHVVVDGVPLVKGRRVTGFSDSEEAVVGLTEIVPFMVEDELKRLGGRYEKAADWQSLAIVDGKLITGQNPASSGAVAHALVKLLRG